MTRKRANGEGSLYQTKAGKWIGALTVGYTPDGKQVRQTVSGDTRKEVREKLDALIRQRDNGLPVRLEKQTVKQFLERWLEDIIKQRDKPRTYDSYRGQISKHIYPAVGHLPLGKLTPQHLQAIIRTMKDANLTPRTIVYTMRILRQALDQAMKWNLLPRNVARLVETPRDDKPERPAITLEQAHTTLRAVRGDRLEAMYYLALYLGMRQGELLGLRWQDVDLKAGTIRVTQQLVKADGGRPVFDQPKTKRSRRTLPLIPILIDQLRAHRVRQLEERLQAGATWTDYDLVFPTDRGTAIYAQALQYAWRRLQQTAGLTPIRFHDLRHACATLLAAEGVPARVVMEILGHANIQTTQQVYTHVLDASTREAIETLGRALENVS